MDLSQSILIIGDSGLLGQALVRELTRRNWTHRGLSRHSKDIRCDALDHPALNYALAEAAPQIIINAAGLIDIAACDSTPEQAWLANARLPMQLAEYSKQKNCYLIQVSTDHYYIGDGATPHDEKSTTTCVNEYARSKLAGEILALSHNETLVVRTNIVGFRQSGKPTFVEWAIEQLQHQKPTTLFTDFFTSSISTTQFSAALLDIIAIHPTGYLNLAAREGASKYDFVHALAKACNLDTAYCQAGRLEDMPSVKRANSLVLDVSRAEKLLKRQLPGLQSVVEQLAVEYRSLQLKNGDLP